MRRETQSGFTLLEVLTVVAVVAVVAAVGAPAMTDYVRNARITATVNDFIASTVLARSEAIKRRMPVTVCTADDPLAADAECAPGSGWETGWLVFQDTDGDTTRDDDEPILDRHGPLGGSVSVVPSAVMADYVSFSTAGETRDIANASVTGSLLICDDRGVVDKGSGISTARAMNVSRTGRAQSLRHQSEIDLVVANEGLNCP